mmetsp:Transcript_4209/g.4700  ORF Transcript_4209/g.4700 Transcript_4209/m.4700 type:complete len:425 (-) Transcript_4209:97-1371(-)
MATSSSFSNIQEMLKIAQGFMCPVHPHLRIKMFCVTERSFVCVRCLDEKPDYWEYKKVQTNQDAVKIVYEYFRESPCELHKSEIATHFCNSEGIAKCMDCGRKCVREGHTLADIETLYSHNMDELKKIDDSVSNFRKKYFPFIEKEISNFISQEANRINQEFDQYISILNERRTEILAELPNRLSDYLNSQHYLTQSSLNAWNTLTDQTRKMHKSQLIKSFSPQDSQISHKIHSMKSHLNHSTQIHRRFVTEKELTSKTLFLSQNLIDLSSTPFLSHTPIDHNSTHWLKVPSHLFTESQRLGDEKPAKQVRQSKADEESKRVCQISPEEAKQAFLKFRREYDMIKEEYSEEMAQLKTADLHDYEIKLEASRKLVSARKAIRDLCEKYKNSLKLSKWNREHYLALYLFGWNSEMLTLMRPYFASE